LTILWPPLVIGLVVLVVGFFAAKYSDQLADFFKAIQRSTMGKMGSAVADNTPRGSMGVVGIGAMGMGVLFILVSLFYRSY
jgi:hypothetical protein